MNYKKTMLPAEHSWYVTRKYERVCSVCNQCIGRERFGKKWFLKHHFSPLVCEGQDRILGCKEVIDLQKMNEALE